MTHESIKIIINLNNYSSIPKYIQVADTIANDILNGIIKKEERHLLLTILVGLVHCPVTLLIKHTEF
jgi:hypothetical protein